MKKVYLLLVFCMVSVVGFGQIISQYVETNSGTTPKGIEIWNNTLGTLDFSTNNLVIEKGVNGGAPSSDFTLSSGTLASGQVIVIGTSDMQSVAEGNGATFFLKGFIFNGDDALVVKYGGTTTDVFGVPNVDPGTAWAGSGVSTANQNIQLLTGIKTGSTGFSDPSTRFETVSIEPNNIAGGGLTGIGTAPSTALPIAIISFTAQKQSTATLIKWTTATEINNDYMAIERSADGRTFEEIGRVQGAGNTQTEQFYHFVDDAPLSGLNYYRLRQVDFDGRFEYHKTVVVNFAEAGESKLLVYPTLASEQLQIVANQEVNDGAQLQILGADGRVWKSIRWLEKSGHMECLIEDLPTGSYWLRLLDGESVQQAYFQKL